ncbi:hypothetical protein HELRODRAFT_105133 [Helobdella robusta]|uniref:Serine hydroxymethyltransferase-like domain-containing protein n=1 Tax=Helobdella robusta TaxID=6412 RepID=T1EDR1_HELRO|nr:hypothetical protein HELRODRAFT_105133 [Helobdella robusta]ESN99883.1 hypothetical protein HELRODRAFT_105133 [Helobdella robusta]
MANALLQKGCTLVSGGTDNHLVLWDLRTMHLDGARMEWICDMCNITVNKNTCPGDKSALNPGGLRLGAAALTSRSFREEDFVKVVEFLERAAQIALRVKDQTKTLKEFRDYLSANDDNNNNNNNNRHQILTEVKKLKSEIETFSSGFPMPGLDDR